MEVDASDYMTREILSMKCEDGKQRDGVPFKISQ